MKRTLVLASAFALMSLAGPAQAQMQAEHRPGEGWRLLAFKTVGMGSDRDVIRVNANRAWRRLQLCSINAPIQMQDFRVSYRNGGDEDVRVRSHIGAGTCTRAIDLRGGDRRITQISLVYGKLDRSTRVPLVRVMAR